MALPPFVGVEHPDYNLFNLDWLKYRLTYEGGRIFKNRYLEKFSDFESATDFERRCNMTYCPTFSKAAINDIRNSVYQRFVDIKRIGGPASYIDAVAGNDGGVDRCGSSMNSFMGCKILPELMVIGKVGIYVDKPPLRGPARIDNVGLRPYVYYYTAEDIINWNVDERQNIRSVVLRENVYEYNENNFPIRVVQRYRHVYQNQDGIFVQLYNNTPEEKPEPVKLELSRIPFYLSKLSHSLMVDISDYQIALLNIASSDINFIHSSNFPFYVEQYDPVSDLQNAMKQNIEASLTTEGAETTAEQSGEQKARIGLTTGRRYPKGTLSPDFINPSTEPLQASMAKQEQLKAEIRLLLNLSIANLQPKRQSADSKAADERPLENGLSYIGLELEQAERAIAEIWADYEKAEPATIHYPSNYSLKSDEDNQKEAEEIEKNLSKIPSQTYQKELGKRAARLRLGCNVSLDTMKKIEKEIDSSISMNSDPDVLTADIENGLVGLELASKLRGYPEGEVEKAKEDHAAKLALISKYQSQGGINGDARGVKEQATDPKGARQEKKDSQNTGESINPTDNTRGEGK